MLGNQFRNTYWQEAGGEVDHQFTDTGHRSPTHVVRNGVPGNSTGTTTIYGTSNAASFPDPKQHQGLLFHPLTGTGRKGDPTESPDARRQLIVDQYKLDPTSDTFRKNHVRAGGSAKISGPKASKFSEMAVDQIDNSGLSTREIRDLPNPPSVGVSQTLRMRNADGFYSNTVHLAAAKVHTSNHYTSSVERVAIAGGEPLRNPKPLDPDKWYLRGVSEDTGESDYQPPVAHEHLWMGKGKPNEKYVSERVWERPPEVDEQGRTVKYGQPYDTWGRDRYTDNTPLYVRKKATEWEEKVVRKKTTSQRLSPGTLAHELGHGYHGTDDEGLDAHAHRKWADPLYEGVADGFQDRHSLHANSFPEHLTPSPVRKREPGGPPVDVTSGDIRRGELENGGAQGGYGAKHKQWGNNVERALYTAMRQHTAVTGQIPRPDERRATLGHIRGPASVPGRVSYPDKGAYQDANMLVLGRMYDEHPHVREAVDALGLSDVGTGAREHYRTASGISHRESRDSGTQLKLF